MSRKYFGTDGIRGKVGRLPITVDFALKLGNAVGKVLVSNGHAQQVILGQDTRASGDMLKSAFISGVTAAGVDVINLGVVPTPVVAFMVRALKVSAGVVLTASHNPYSDNGIKLFSAQGQKLSDEVEYDIEQEIDREFYYHREAKFGRIISQINQIEPYISHCVKCFCDYMNASDLADKKIILDCANGAMYRVARSVFDQLGIPYKEIASAPNGVNINASCGAVDLDLLKQSVITEGADLGIAFDGDGDRLMLIDEMGEIVDGDDMLSVLSQHPDIVGKVKGVVGTVMTNLAIEHDFKKRKINFQRAKVGDRYVLELLTKHQWSLGAEASGHIINLHYNTTGDGLLAALQILAVMAKTDQSLSDLTHIQKMPQVMINVPLIRQVGADDLSLLIQDVSFVEKNLKNNGRVVLRPSGTEPVLRVMVEAKHKADAKHWADYLVQKVTQKI